MLQTGLLNAVADDDNDLADADGLAAVADDGLAAVADDDIDLAAAVAGDDIDLAADSADDLHDLVVADVADADPAAAERIQASCHAASACWEVRLGLALPGDA